LCMKSVSFIRLVRHFIPYIRSYCGVE
jgi:hypothetical protein